MSFLMQKKVVVDGVTYTLQRIPLKAWLDLNDRCTNKHGVLIKSQYVEEILKHIVVSPKLTISSFDDNIPACMELVSEAESFLNTKADQDMAQDESEE